MSATAHAQAETAGAVVDRFNAAWDAHDLDAALEMISDDCVFDATSPAPDGERFTGKAAIAAAWKAIFDDTASRFTAEESFAAGSRVVVRWRYDWAGGHVRGVDVFAVLGRQDHPEARLRQRLTCAWPITRPPWPRHT